MEGSGGVPREQVEVLSQRHEEELLFLRTQLTGAQRHATQWEELAARLEEELCRAVQAEERCRHSLRQEWVARCKVQRVCVCLYIYVCICVHIRLFVCVFLCMYLCLCVHEWLHLSVCLCNKCTHLRRHVCVYVYVCPCVYACICDEMVAYWCECLHICMIVCVCLCIKCSCPRRRVYVWMIVREYLNVNGGGMFVCIGACVFACLHVA